MCLSLAGSWDPGCSQGLATHVLTTAQLSATQPPSCSNCHPDHVTVTWLSVKQYSLQGKPAFFFISIILVLVYKYRDRNNYMFRVFFTSPYHCLLHRALDETLRELTDLKFVFVNFVLPDTLLCVCYLLFRCEKLTKAARWLKLDTMSQPR